MIVLGKQGSKDKESMSGFDLKKDQAIPMGRRGMLVWETETSSTGEKKCFLKRTEGAPSKDEEESKKSKISIKEGEKASAVNQKIVMETKSEHIRSEFVLFRVLYPKESSEVIAPEMWGSTILDVSLLSVSIPNTQYNVNADSKDVICFNRGTLSYSVIIPPGHYDVKSLTSTLTDLMNKEDPDNGYEVKYDTITKRLTFSGTSPFSFDWKEAGSVRDARLFLGMSPSSQELTFHTGAYTPDLTSCLNVYVVVDFLKKGVYQKSATFPIILDEDKEVTVRNFDNMTQDVGLWYTPSWGIRVFLVGQGQVRVPDIGRFSINTRIRYQKERIIIKDKKQIKRRLSI